MNRIKRVALGVTLALTLATAASAAYTVFSFDGYTDFTVATPHDKPCGYVGLKGTAQPVTFDKTLWLVFTCQDESVIARRLYVTSATEPVNLPPIVPSYTGLPKPASDPACEMFPGFVESMYGGCVPPDHPHAKK